MWTREVWGTDVYHVLQWFLVYSILGWMVESAYMSVCNRKITNRGFATGPFCPIYGVGALSVYFLLQPYQGNYLKLYFLGALIATALEFAVAHLMQQFFGEVWWDYREKPFNYKGILCLESTVAWGFYTVFLFLFLQGFVERIVNSYPVNFGKKASLAVVLFCIADLTWNLYQVKKEEVDRTVERVRKMVLSFRDGT